jgi:exonuclease SbcD
MTDTLRLVHCSDIHLDGDAGYYGKGIGPRAMFERALAAMAEHAPDLMLIAGDLFDSNRARPETVEWSMEALAGLPFPIFMIPGNHDCMLPNGIFQRYDFNGIENLHFLCDAKGEIVHHEPLGVSVWGKGMPDHTPEYRPVADWAERPDGCRWYLGMGHGMFVPEGEDSDRSSPIAHSDVAASPFDYLALGHHHAAMEIVTDGAIAAYSGSPTDDAGGAPTYAFVELGGGNRPKVEIIRLA